MTKLTGAALDRAVAHAMGVKSVHNCEKWGEHMKTIIEMAREYTVGGLEFDVEGLERFVNDVRADERENTNNAYKERNQLVALLSILFPSGKAKTAIEGWDEAWHGCVYIDFPWGQASWHYHSDDEQMFTHLPPYKKLWDGHTTEDKYAAIFKAIRARGNI